MSDCYFILKCGLVEETGGKASGDEQNLNMKVTVGFLACFCSLTVTVHSKGIRIIE